MPFALPTAQADVQGDFQIRENLTVRGNFVFINPDSPDLKRWRWWAESLMRHRESGKELNHSLFRAGTGYALNARSIMFVGYAHITNQTIEKTGLNQENRIW